MGITKKINAIILLCVLGFYTQIFSSGFTGPTLKCDSLAISGSSVVLHLSFDMLGVPSGNTVSSQAQI